MSEGKSQRGGSRKGAGRPKGTSRLYAFRADKDIADLIDQQENKTEFIRGCVARELETRYRTYQESKVPDFGIVTPANKVAPLSLPFFDIKLVAGFPVPLDNDELAQNIELLKMLCPNPDSSYLIRVTGDSMIESGINNGDILIVDKSNRHPSEHQAAVCELNGEYTVKRVVSTSEGLFLVPSNPDYPNIPVKEGDQFSVWGVVTYVIHKPKY